MNSQLLEGRLWLALQLAQEDQENEAVEELETLPQPKASYALSKV